MGAYKALSSYNKVKGKFSSYAYPFCKHEILENYNINARQISISLNTLKNRKVIALSNYDNQSNTINDLNKNTRDELDYFNSYHEDSIQEFSDSEDLDNNKFDYEILDSQKNTKFDSSDFSEDEYDLDSLINQLNQKDKNIIRARFFEDKTLEVIAKENGVSKEAIRKSEKRALKHLRELKN